ncbi:hypothetical protein [Chitinophaga arvensicola]|nr:hypothetical protein [Chitinophaga arvensicola]
MSIILHVVAQRDYSKWVYDRRVTGNSGYQFRSKDERYEGLFNPDFVGERFKLVAVLRGDFSYELADNANLVFQFPAKIKYDRIGIIGESYGLDINYHLDLIVNRNERKVVPVKSVLQPQHIYASNLGIYGYVGDPESPELFIPVNIDPGKQGDISVTIVAAEDVEKVMWRYAKARNGVCEGYGNWKVVNDFFPQHEGINIPLEIGSEVDTGEEICVDMQFQVKGRSAPLSMKTFKILIIH